MARPRTPPPAAGVACLGLTSFAALTRVMSPEAVVRLAGVYRSVNDIDLYIGGVAERAALVVVWWGRLFRWVSDGFFVNFCIRLCLFVESPTERFHLQAKSKEKTQYERSLGCEKCMMNGPS